MNAMRRADIIGTDRQQSPVDPVVTEVALMCNPPAHVKINGVVRATAKAGLAAGAALGIKDHDSIASPGDCPIRANVPAGGVLAVTAAVDPVHEKRDAIEDVRPVFNDAYQPDTVGGIHLLLAGHLAGSATPAGRRLDRNVHVLHDAPFPCCFSG